jgi:isopenicillin N synthase-like dioxygenase
MAILTVPILDIAPYWGGTAARKREMAQQVDEACRDIGFLIIAGHGVSPDLIAAVDEVSRGFFDLPLEEKMRVARPAPDVTRGYPYSDTYMSMLSNTRIYGRLKHRLPLSLAPANSRFYRHKFGWRPQVTL